MPAATTQLWDLLDAVKDPEIPVVSIRDLGILQDVQMSGGAVKEVITPTYSGCPAMDMIRDEVRTTLEQAGYDQVEVRTVFSPAWTTDWMSEDGKRKLEAFGIAAPIFMATGSLDGKSRVTGLQDPPSAPMRPFSVNRPREHT